MVDKTPEVDKTPDEEYTETRRARNPARETQRRTVVDQQYVI